MDQEIVPSDAAGTLSVKIVPPDVWNAIQDLHKVLRYRYGCDFAYTIAANGHVIGASNLVRGLILPRLHTDPL